MKTTVVVESLSYCKTNVLFQRILKDFNIYAIFMKLIQLITEGI